MHAQWFKSCLFQLTLWALVCGSHPLWEAAHCSKTSTDFGVRQAWPGFASQPSTSHQSLSVSLSAKWGKNSYFIRLLCRQNVVMALKSLLYGPQYVLVHPELLLEAQVHACHAQSCPTFCGTVDCSPPGSSVHGIFQSRILEWVAILFSRGWSRPRDWTRVSCVSCIGRRILYHCATWEAPVAQGRYFLFVSHGVFILLRETLAGY